MSAVLIENQIDVRAGNESAVVFVDSGEMAVDLGIWLSGLQSFLVAGHHSFADSPDIRAVPDASKEFRLVHSTLQRCALMTSGLLSSGDWIRSEETTASGLSAKGIRELADSFRDALMLSDGLIRSNRLGPGEWKAWSRMLALRISDVPTFSGLIAYAERSGENFLPAALKAIGEGGSVSDPDHSELALIVPRFAKILRWLSVVGRMLEADEPLKPALLIFSRVNEQIFELTTYINNSLQRFPNEEAELFAALDAASYTASIELKKVYSQELAGLARLRPSPSIYARMETAYSLLNEGFQQILAGFAQLIDPSADVFKLFPNFGVKREQSILLRETLWSVLQKVQDAEKNPEQVQIETLHTGLREFLAVSGRFLFYKDTETVERFIEEILVTKQNKDLVPILHRFGAYLETLFGQVNLRSVLVDSPFTREPA